MPFKNTQLHHAGSEERQFQKKLSAAAGSLTKFLSFSIHSKHFSQIQGDFVQHFPPSKPGGTHTEIIRKRN